VRKLLRKTRRSPQKMIALQVLGKQRYRRQWQMKQRHPRFVFATVEWATPHPIEEIDDRGERSAEKAKMKDWGQSVENNWSAMKKQLQMGGLC